MSSTPLVRQQVYPLRGMDHRFRPAPQTAMLMRDLTWDQREGWTSSGGFRRITEDYEGEGGTVNGFDGYGEIVSIHWFAQHTGGRQWLIWEEDVGGGLCSLVAFNGSTSPSTPGLALRDSEGNAWNGSSRPRTVVDGPWFRTQSAAWGGRLYLVNGYDEPICFDGRKTTRAGFSGPPAPPEAQYISNAFSGRTAPTMDYPELGLGVVDQKYGCRYRVSFLNQYGQESPLSEASTLAIFDNHETVGTKGGLNVTLPIGGPGVVARRVYRTVNVLDEGGNPIAGADEVFFFLVEINDNDMTSFEDYRPDSALGSVVDELDFGPWPTSAKFLAVFKNTMFLAGTSDNQVRFSAPGYPEVFPVDNVFDISDSTGGPITGLYSTKNALLVFRNRAIFLIKGDPSSGFYAQPLTRDLGCNAPRTVRDLPGLGVVFANESGVYLLEGALTDADPTKIVPLSTPISDLYAEINKSALLNAFAEINHEDREYMLWISRLGEVKPTRILVFHYENGSWTYRDGFPMSCAIAPNDHRGYLFMGSHDTAHYPGVMVYSRGWDDKGGQADIEPYYEGAPISFGNLYEMATIEGIQFTVVGHGTNTVSVNFRGNRRMTKGYHADPEKTEPQHYPYDIDEEDSAGNDLFPVYGEAVWDAAHKWCTHRPVVLRVSQTGLDLPPLHEIQSIVAPTGRQFTIIGYELDAKGGTPVPRMMTLNSAYGGGANR